MAESIYFNKIADIIKMEKNGISLYGMLHAIKKNRNTAPSEQYIARLMEFCQKMVTERRLVLSRGFYTLPDPDAPKAVKPSKTYKAPKVPKMAEIPEKVAIKAKASPAFKPKKAAPIMKSHFKKIPGVKKACKIGTRTMKADLPVIPKSTLKPSAPKTIFKVKVPHGNIAKPSPTRPTGVKKQIPLSSLQKVKVVSHVKATTVA